MNQKIVQYCRFGKNQFFFKINSFFKQHSYLGVKRLIMLILLGFGMVAPAYGQKHLVTEGGERYVPNPQVGNIAFAEKVVRKRTFKPMQDVDDGKALIINLGDYAKGDGSDETDVIQKVIDRFNYNPTLQNKDFTFRRRRGILIIPAPKKFYGISKTINIVEKWNLEIRCETPATLAMNFPAYFKWIGPDKGTMFYFNFCMGLNVVNLTLCGDGKDVIGIKISERGNPYKKSRHLGIFKVNRFERLAISKVKIGIKIGEGNGGADIAFNSFRDVHIKDFTTYGLHYDTANGADNTFENLYLDSSRNPIEGIRVTGGQLMVNNSCIGGNPNKARGAAVAVYGGGINLYGCWSEWAGIFLSSASRKPMPSRKKTDASGRYSTILIGVQHYPGLLTSPKRFWTDKGKERPESDNTIPLSVKWDYPAPLTLMNCCFYGGVEIGAKSRNPVISIGTTFSNRDSLRFHGEGIKKYRNLLQIGTTDPKNIRIIEPYIVDRRNTPGTQAPQSGFWKKGDCIRNIDPDSKRPEKSWAGWICVKEGEPGKWMPYGRLGK